MLYGDYNPSGRLPYTIAKNASDYPAKPVLDIWTPNYPIIIPYTEGYVLSFTHAECFTFTQEVSVIRLLIDYRWFDAVRPRFHIILLVLPVDIFDQKQITPRFEFGFGLSYTTFEYSNLTIEELSNWPQFPEDSIWDSGETPSTNATGASRAIWLHRPTYNITFNVQNVGGVAGTEVSSMSFSILYPRVCRAGLLTVFCQIPQLYLEFPASSGEPPQTLKGFANVALEPGECQKAYITVSKFDLSYWDVIGQGWKKPDGQIGVLISQSSRKVVLQGTM